MDWNNLSHARLQNQNDGTTRTSACNSRTLTNTHTHACTRLRAFEHTAHTRGVCMSFVYVNARHTVSHAGLTLLYMLSMLLFYGVLHKCTRSDRGAASQMCTHANTQKHTHLIRMLVGAAAAATAAADVDTAARQQTGRHTVQHAETHTHKRGGESEGGWVLERASRRGLPLRVCCVHFALLLLAAVANSEALYVVFVRLYIMFVCVWRCCVCVFQGARA